MSARRFGALALAVALACAPAWGAQVRIPMPSTSAGNLGSAKVSVRLVTADGKPVLGFVGTDLQTAYADLPLTGDLVLTLAPQTAIALPGGAATYYDIAIATRAKTERYRVQVADVPQVQELRDLVAASAIDGSDLGAQVIEELRGSMEATAADRVQTGLDAAATAADRVQTGADRVQTGLDKAATAADRVQTGADRVQTELDALSTASDLATFRTEYPPAYAWMAYPYVWGSDSMTVEPGQRYTMRLTGAGRLGGMLCYVVAPPAGGAITFDLRVGSPPVSIYASGSEPTIAARAYQTSATIPEEISPPIALTAGTPLQIRVVSGPSGAASWWVSTVSDLPTGVAGVSGGTLVYVVADGHTWTAQSATWTDLGLAEGAGTWTGTAATVAELPGSATVGQIYFVIADKHLYTRAAGSWTDSGLAPGASGWAGVVATTIARPTTAALAAQYLVAADKHVYQNTQTPWTDQGVLTFSGAGLRCTVYVYPPFVEE